MYNKGVPVLYPYFNFYFCLASPGPKYYDVDNNCNDNKIFPELLD